MKEKLKICIATSTRADWGLLSPLAHALDCHQDVQLDIIATNMHLLPRYGSTVSEIEAEGFGSCIRVPMPDTSDDPASKAEAMAQCMSGTAKALSTLRPDAIVILGDRYEMLAVASAAAVMRIPIVHIAGGEVSEGAIDDSIRHAITKLASLHLTETEAYRQRVISMGESPDTVINAGALGVWNAVHQPLMSAAELSDSIGFDIVPGRTLLVTYHPATLDSVGSGERCDALLSALDCFKDYKVVITYPNNDTGSEQIIERILRYGQDNPDRVLVIKSLGMRRYLSLLQYAAAVVGNSSSGIIEVPSMGTPTVDIGIRQRGRISAQSVIHCGDTEQDIREAISLALSPPVQQLAATRVNPYHKENTVEVMVEAIIAYVSSLHDTAASSGHNHRAPGAHRPLYIIPARGGSKGIPKKNIKELCGKPLIGYSIDTAVALAPDLRHIVLSTDSDEIAAVAEAYGLPVPYRRPAALATDTAGSREMMLDAMDWADARGIDYDCVVLLQPTSPMRTADDVRRALDLYSDDIDMVVSVTESSANPYYNCFETDPTTGYLHISKGDGLYTRRQDAPPVYEYNGAVYVINPASLRREPMGVFTKRIPLPMPRERSIDLDTPLDWTIAEAVIGNCQTSSSQS